MNALVKYRRDLEDEYSKVTPRNQTQSVQFLKDHGLWDAQAKMLMHSIQHWTSVYHDGPDEWSKEKLTTAQSNLMCHLVELIRKSASV
jgi:hypothetical protein